MSEKQSPLLAFVGGFLGAGKTTLILRAAELLRARGQRPAVIMNDQDAGLVDTQHALAHHIHTREVSGGCFCCRFSDLMEAADQLADYGPDVILAEPVGSCIDLSATILQPLRAFHQKEYRLAPLTVLLDPEMSDRVVHSDLPQEIQYLVKNQLAEADLLCLTKIDCHTHSPELPFPIDFRLSAKTGEGVAEWLNEILVTTRVAGARLLQVDYAQYGAAEAALGWLNLHASIQLFEPSSPLSVCGPLLDEIEGALTSAQIVIAHLKIFDRGASGWIKASICSNGQEPVPTGDLLAAPAQDHELAINLRAVADPARLEGIVRQALAGVPGHVQIRHFGAFRPAQPTPEHRFAHRA
ncbi:MAG: hypothetical protein JOY85_08905 [Acidobacteriaceae bacterium]|nr:hypothetical protein [Acidobacteriaceae bacterium]